MADSSIVAFFLTKAKALGGPVVAALCLGAAGGYAMRTAVADRDAVVQRVAAIETTYVSRGELRDVVGRLEDVAARQDSTNALLRRYICREQPVICP